MTLTWPGAVDMDLSSLEGPPLFDERFAPRTRIIDRPRGQIRSWTDTSYGTSRSPVSPLTPTPTTPRANTLWDWEKPASAPRRDSRRMSRMEAREIPRCLQTGRSQEENGVEHYRSYSSQSSVRVNEQPELRISQSYSNLPVSRSPGTRHQNPSLQTMLANDRLVWLEDRQIWLLMESSPATPMPLPQAQNTNTYHVDQTPRRNSMIIQYYDPWSNQCEEDDDSPPSYESHGFVHVPTTNRPTHTASWCVVARRMGRTLFP